MKRKSLLVLLPAFVASYVLLMSHSPAGAIATFKKGFESKYVKKDSLDPAIKKFAETATKAKCNICHVGKKKKNLNSYGAALGELLDKKKDKKDKKKIIESLEKVAKMKSDESNKKSLTYGELIEQGKLPGRELKEEKNNSLGSTDFVPVNKEAR